MRQKINLERNPKMGYDRDNPTKRKAEQIIKANA
jgi:hypothetical protein